ncbi:MAG: hypothetical protein JRG91_03550 [Deltaproteobacteria bacterium]|nr:hypothetical protein [Deltaproteobacteria bacterium]
MSYETSVDPIEGAALLRLTFSARDELDDPNFKAIYKGVLLDLGLSDGQVRRYIEKHKAELVEKLRVIRPVRSGG